MKFPRVFDEMLSSVDEGSAEASRDESTVSRSVSADYEPIQFAHKKNVTM